MQMTNNLIRVLLVVLVLAVGCDLASAQKRVVKKRAATTKKTTNKNTGVKDANLVADTTPVVAPVPDLGGMGTVRKSLRNDNAVEESLVKDRTPLEYENIRVDDAVFRQRLWREIDVHEKNQPAVCIQGR
jgi:hypothetical protein